MPGGLTLIEGPPGSGKSQEVKKMLASGALDVVADLTELWAAVRGIERDRTTWRYPIRSDNDVGVGMANYLRATVVRQGLREGLEVGVTSGTPDTATKWQSVAAESSSTFRVITIDPGERVVRERLAVFSAAEAFEETEFGPAVEPQCEKAIGRWYRPRGRR